MIAGNRKMALFGFVMIVAGLAFSYFVWYKKGSDSFEIQDFNYQQDAALVDALFHKQDNWYWMISNSGSNSYSIDFALKYNTSSQFAKKYDLVLKVLKYDGKLAGFLAYYPHSAHVWQLLFLIVDQDFRRQGVAKKLLKYAVEDMEHRGAFKIWLGTRTNNFRAQALYKNFGFHEIPSPQGADDDEFVFFAWYKK